MNASVATVPNFFQQAPVIQDPTSQQFLQQQFLECLFQKKTVVTSFPMGYRAASLYALPAMMSDGMAVVLCPDRFAVARNLRHFRQTGFGFPEVAALDGAVDIGHFCSPVWRQG